MSSTPQPLQPPVLPQPARPSSHVLAIVLLILALIVSVSLVGIWAGLRFISHAVRVRVEEGGGSKGEVSIETPVGSFRVDKGVDEVRLGLPIYPRAHPVKDDSATLRFGLPDNQDLQLVVGKFETSDPIDKVKGFYQERLGNHVTKFVEKDSQGKTVFEIKRKNQERIITLKSAGGGTRIELVRVDHGREEGAN